LWKGKIMATVKYHTHTHIQITGAKGRRKGKWEEQVEHRIFKVVKRLSTTLSWWTHVTMHLPKPTECNTQRENPNVNYRLINCNKSATLMWDVNNRAKRGRDYGRTLCTFHWISENLQLLFNKAYSKTHTHTPHTPWAMITYTLK
jgi:hypothetical protein